MLHLLRLVLFLCLASPALAEGLARSPTPAWVDEIALPADDPDLRAQALDGVHYILSDFQVAFVGEERHSYARTVMQVTDRAGLELAATVSLDFDPAFDRMALTRLVVIRDGREIDLRDSVAEEILRREERLDEGIIDGTLTAYLQIPDLRVGDIVDYASVREMKPLVGAGERSVFATMEWDVPVGLTRTVVLWPKAWPMTLGPLPDRVTHAQGPGPGGTLRHEWRREGHVPPRPEEAVPALDDPTAYLRLTADADWGALSAALTPYYAADYPLTPEWDAKVAVLAAASPDPETRAIAALRLVQDELRYVSLSVGAGGILARLPQEVIPSGFGDCKDKALLLVVMLRKLGVQAQVALTDIDNGAGLPAEVPMLGAFDHAIVRIVVDGEAHWVDPTASHQGGGFATMAVPPYAWALPLAGAGQTGLEPIPEVAETAWSTDVTESYRFTAGGVFLTVRSVYLGGAADSLRQRFATSPRRQISDDYLDFYLGRYAGLTLQDDIVMQDDRATNRLTMEERYVLPRAALKRDGLDLDFPFAAEDFASNLPDRLIGPRTLPMDSGGPAVFRHVVEVKGAGFDFNVPDPVRLRNAAFAYDFTGRAPVRGEMVLAWTHRRTGGVVPAAEVAAVLRDAETVHDTTWFGWNVQPE
ncbi:DUF3857 domain-containing transglutaminase family protein [Rhodobacter sp. Har01]|uniref:DUF3857 domain-containing transglutaminase family protein n=1 Tax=Rhodobacter sp. Har01 TaxID=2883999 RepID=UPI001D091627|nr:DUF3857 domain-containing transglutaminase family protein [Rhodobacter sp. Har01]MCB6179142.1 DUF3857 domain-containing transglutaminase family protein [Rhodobacter sp. Har01]